MKLYVAGRRIPYEGGCILGIYRSEEAAQTRIDEYKNSKLRCYNDGADFSIDSVDTNTDLTVWF